MDGGNHESPHPCSEIPWGIIWYIGIYRAGYMGIMEKKMETTI